LVYRLRGSARVGLVLFALFPQAGAGFALICGLDDAEQLTYSADEESLFFDFDPNTR